MPRQTTPPCNRVVTIDRNGYRLKSLSQNKAGLEISQIDYQKGGGTL